MVSVSRLRGVEGCSWEHARSRVAEARRIGRRGYEGCCRVSGGRSERTPATSCVKSSRLVWRSPVPRSPPPKSVDGFSTPPACSSDDAILRSDGVAEPRRLWPPCAHRREREATRVTCDSGRRVTAHACDSGRRIRQRHSEGRCFAPLAHQATKGIVVLICIAVLICWSRAALALESSGAAHAAAVDVSQPLELKQTLLALRLAVHVAAPTRCHTRAACPVAATAIARRAQLYRQRLAHHAVGPALWAAALLGRLQLDLERLLARLARRADLRCALGAR